MAAGADLTVANAGLFDLVATFTDADAADVHSATIDWGDGSAVEDGDVDQGTNIVTKSHTYSAAGPFTVTVTVSDGAASGSDTRTITRNSLPVVTANDATITFPTTSFDLSSVSYADADVADVHTATVDWGDGTTDTNVTATAGALSASHDYATSGPGPFTVTVTVHDPLGDTGSDDLVLTVVPGNSAPVVDAGADRAVSVNTTYTYTATFTDADVADVHTASINWGDGTATQDLGAVTGGTVQASHPYLTTGTFTVTVTVTDQDDAAGVDTVDFLVTSAPVVDAGPDQTINLATTLNLTATFTDADATHTGSIDWGDGDIDTPTPDSLAGTISGSHAYVTSGVFTVLVTVADIAEVGTDSLTVTVTDAPVIDTLADATLDEGATLSLASIGFVDSSDQAHTATIDWGDGSPVEDVTSLVDQVNDLIAGASHLYADDLGGPFTVTITVTDDQVTPLAGTTTFVVTVNNVAPTLLGGANKSAVGGDTVTLDVATYSDPAGAADAPYDAQIDWGDGTVEAGTVDSPAAGRITWPTHVYSTTADYVVTITLTDKDGGVGTDTIGVFVPPTVTAVDPDQGAAGDPVTITGTNFNANVAVTFGGASATSIAVIDSTTIECDVPAGAPGPVTVVVTNLDTAGSGSLIDGFTYEGFLGNVEVTLNPGFTALETAMQDQVSIAPVGTNAVVMVYRDGRTIVPGGTPVTNHDIYFARRDDAGVWSTSVKVNTADETLTPLQQARPDVAVIDSGDVIAVWREGGAGSSHIWGAVSQTGGLTWSAPAQLSTGLASDTAAPRLGYYAPDDVLACVWADSAGQIQFAEFDGAAFLASVPVTTVTAGETNSDPDVTFFTSGPDTFGVVTFARTSTTSRSVQCATTDDGVTFTVSPVFDSGTTVGSTGTTRVESDAAGNMVVVWADSRDLGSGLESNIFSSGSADGVTWTAAVLVNDDGVTSVTQSAPTLALDGNGLFVAAFTDSRDGDLHVYTSTTTDPANPLGFAWSQNLRGDDVDTLLAAGAPALAALADGTSGFALAYVDGRHANGEVQVAPIDGAGVPAASVTVTDAVVERANQQLARIVASPTGVLVSVWRDDQDGLPGIFASTYAGGAWSTPVRVDDGATGANRARNRGAPALAVDASGDLVCVWSDDRTGDFDVYSARSIDDGASWSGQVRVSDDAGTFAQTAPAVTAGSVAGTFVVVWVDDRDGDAEVFGALTSTGGQVWTASSQVTTDAVAQSDPVVVVTPSDGVIVAYAQGTDLHASYATAFGSVWTPVLVSSAANDQTFPQLAIDTSVTPSRVVAVWRSTQDTNNGDVYASSTEDGSTWAAAVLVTTPQGNSPVGRPFLAARPTSAGGGVVCGFTQGNANVKMTQSQDAGASWSASNATQYVVSDSGTGDRFNPAICVNDAGVVGLIWEDFRNGDRDLFFSEALVRQP